VGPEVRRFSGKRVVSSGETRGSAEEKAEKGWNRAYRAQMTGLPMVTSKDRAGTRYCK
jgi:hypothetical protein